MKTKNKGNKRYSLDGVIALLSNVRSFDITSVKDVAKADELTEALIIEYLEVRKWYDKRLERNKNNKQLQARYEAEKRVVLGVLKMLTEKMTIALWLEEQNKKEASK